MPYNIESVLDELRSAQEQANQANEQRFAEVRELLEGNRANITSRGEAALGELDNLGGSARERVRRDFREGTAEDITGLLGRGLGNTTVFNQLQNQRRSDRDLALTDIDERVAQLRSGALERLSDRESQGTRDLAGAIERVTDAAPYQQTLQTLLQQLGEAEGAEPDHAYNVIGASGTGGGGSGFGRSGASGGGGGSGGGGSGGGGGGRRSGVQTHRNTGAPAHIGPQTVRNIPGAGRPGPGWVLRAGQWQAPPGTPITNNRYG